MCSLKENQKEEDWTMQIMLCCKAVWSKILVHQEQGLTGSDKRLGRVVPGTRITPGACQQFRSSSEYDLNFLQKGQEIVVLDQKG